MLLFVLIDGDFYKLWVVPELMNLIGGGGG